jgi:16S rRNA (guanine(966)-N(2))-methyltransferase RsmD
MRVISGRARGTKLKTIESMSTRPTLDRVKESLFNILQNDITEKNVLDLFAGSGALGIEALSRGANKAYFSDSNPEAVKVIKENLTKTRFIDYSKVYNMSYEKAITKMSNENVKIDIVFIDPPYRLGIAANSIKLIIQNDLLNENAIIVVETDEKERDIKEILELKNLNKELQKIEITDLRKYGRASLIFLRV